MKHFKAKMAPILEKGLVKLHFRSKEFVPEGHSEETVSDESSNKDGGASDEENGEHRSKEPRPPTVLERGLIKLHLRPKESVLEKPPKNLIREENSKDGAASEANGGHGKGPSLPNDVSEEGRAKLHLHPKDRVYEGRSKELVSEESSKDADAHEENSELHSERRPPQVRILNDTDLAVSFHGLLERAKEVILPVCLLLVVLEAESNIEYYDLMLMRNLTPNTPVNSECPDCKVVRTIAYKQRIYAKGIRFYKGEHTIKVAWTLPGNLAPSSHTCLGAITYDFRAVVNTRTNERIYSEWQPLLIKRDNRPLPQNSFHRTFPTPRSEVVTVTTVPQTIYPTGEFPVRLRLTNLKTPERDVSGNLCHWRWWLHKVDWRIIEQTTWVSNGCLTHTPRSNLFQPLGTSVEDENLDVRTMHDDRREIGSGAFHEGWSTDFGYAGFGKIDFDFTVSTNLAREPVCSFRTLDGECCVQHFLSIDMRLEDDMTGDLIGQVIPPQRFRVISQLIVEDESAKKVDWDEADLIIADADADADADSDADSDADDQLAMSSINRSEMVLPQTDDGVKGEEEKGKEVEEKSGGDRWFVPGKPDERGRLTYIFVSRGSRDQSTLGRQQVPQLELEEGTGGRGGIVDDDEERLRPIIPDS